MKSRVALLVLLLKTSVTCAQIDWGEYSQSFETEEKISLIVAMRSDNNSFWDWDGETELFLRAKNDSTALGLNGNHIIARTTYDSSNVHFFASGVDRSNAHLFEFRVLEYPSKRTLKHWKQADRFSTDAVNRQSGLPPMAYLGSYKTGMNSMVLVQLRGIKDHTATRSAMVAWITIRPRIGGIFSNENLGTFLKRLQYPWVGKKSDEREVNLNEPLPAGDNNLVVQLNANIYHKEQIQYRVERDGEADTDWRDNDFDNSFVWLKRDAPGKYVLHIRYTAQPGNVTSVQFEIAPAWYQTLAFRIAMIVLGVVLLAGVVLLTLYVRQRNQNHRTQIHRNKLQLELKGIYAQWNPHFVFNALGSIQGLINKNDLQAANQYLSDFARLMRESLTRGQRESVSLHEELQTLETYLKLEQLRFGFRFTLECDKTIDVYATDIPAQLLQPLVENAVKHGVATDSATGTVHVQFTRVDDTLMITIRDNGRGFAPDQNLSGFGLKMTSDRINLLNQMNASQPITLDISSTRDAGTCITITFNHWFL